MAQILPILNSNSYTPPFLNKYILASNKQAQLQAAASSGTSHDIDPALKTPASIVTVSADTNVVQTVHDFTGFVLATIESLEPNSWASASVSAHAVNLSLKDAINSLQKGDAGNITIDKYELAKFKGFVLKAQDALSAVKPQMEKSGLMDEYNGFLQNTKDGMAAILSLQSAMGNKSTVTATEFEKSFTDAGMNKTQIINVLKIASTLSEQFNITTDTMTATGSSLVSELYKAFSTQENQIDSEVQKSSIMLVGSGDIQKKASTLLESLTLSENTTPVTLKAKKAVPAPGGPLYLSSVPPGDGKPTVWPKIPTVTPEAPSPKGKPEYSDLSNQYYDITANKGKINADLNQLSAEVQDKSTSAWGEVGKNTTLTESIAFIKSKINAPNTLGTAGHSYIKVSDLKLLEERAADITTTTDSIAHSLSTDIQEKLTDGTRANSLFGMIASKVYDFLKSEAQSAAT